VNTLSIIINEFHLFRSDLNKYRVDFGLFLPYIEVTGNYDVNGNVLLLPVRSRGEFWAAFCKYLYKKIFFIVVKFSNFTNEFNVSWVDRNIFGLTFPFFPLNFYIPTFSTSYIICI